MQDPVQFHSSKEGQDYTVQNRPGSCPDGQVRIWLNASRPEASRCARIIGPGSGRMQPACYQFPTFRLSCIFSQTAHFILCKTSLDPNWFWLTVSRFGQTDLVPKPASVQECYQFPTFRLSCIFSQTAHFILCKTSLDPNWFWLTVSRFGQTDLVPKPASVQESSGSLLAKAA